MRIRYFVIDSNGAIRKASQAAVHGIWEKHRPVSILGFDVGDELRLISAVCDDCLHPKILGVLRLEIRGGEITDRSRSRAVGAARIALRLAQRDLCDTEGNREKLKKNRLWKYHLSGLNVDRTLREMAVALDVPQVEFDLFAAGGPLATASYLGISVRSALELYKFGMMMRDLLDQANR